MCVTCSQYGIFFVLTIDYRTLNLCESDRKQVLSVRLIHCNMTFVGLVIKTIYCNTSSVSPFRVWLGSHLYDSRLGDRLEFLYRPAIASVLISGCPAAGFRYCHITAGR